MEVALAICCELKRVKEKYDWIGRYPEEGFIALGLLLFHSSQALFFVMLYQLENINKKDTENIFNDKQKEYECGFF